VGASRRGCRHSGKPAVVVPAATPLYLQSRVVTVPRSRGRDIGSKKFNNPSLMLVPGSSITPSLVASRVSGVAPLYVHFDATATTSTQTSYPFHECNFKWNFGDTAAGNYSTTGLSRNIAYGGVAGHVFEAAGAFTVTLTIKDSGGATTTTTTTVTVAAANDQYSGTNTICVSTSGNFTGAPPGADTRTTSTWATAMGYVAAGKRVLFRRGESWTATGNTSFGNINSSPVSIGSFGSGALPVVTVSTGYNAILLGNCSDWRISDLSFIGTSSASEGGAVNLGTGSNNTNILISRIETSGFGVPVGGSDYYSGGVQYSHERICIFESYLHGGYIQCVFIPLIKSAILGSRFETSVTSHVLRVIYASKSVISNSISRWSAGNRHTLKFHSGPLGDGAPYSDYNVISDNTFQSAYPEQWCVCIGPQDAGVNEGIRDLIFERNKVTGWEILVMFDNCIDVTCRNNVLIRGSDTQRSGVSGVHVWNRSATAPNSLRCRIYNNTAYAAFTETEYSFVIAWLESGSGHIARNNYGSAPHYTLQYTVLDSTSAVASNNTMTNTPGFVAAGTDFHLAAGSAAINQGYLITSVYDDMDNVAKSAPHDQGAYEYVP